MIKNIKLIIKYFKLVKGKNLFLMIIGLILSGSYILVNYLNPMLLKNLIDNAIEKMYLHYIIFIY